MSTSVETTRANSIDKEAAAKIINSRKLVPSTGYYELKVTSVVPYEGKFIVGLNGMSQYHIEESKKAYFEGNFQKAVNQSFSASLRAIDHVPSKGEIVKVYIDEVTTAKGITGLFVTSLIELKSNKTFAVNLDLSTQEEAEMKRLVEEGAKAL